MSTTAPKGSLAMRKVPAPPLDLSTVRDHSFARPGLPAEVNAWRNENGPAVERAIHDLESSRRGQGPKFLGALWAKVRRAGEPDLDLGLVSGRVVTNAGMAYLVDAFQNLTEVELFRYHGIGTGTAGESPSDTALGTEATTQYTTNNTRPTGTITEGSGTNIFETVATVTVKASIAVTEHGIFTQAGVPGGTLLDRSVFAAINLASGEGVVFTYDLVFPSGS